LKSENCEPSQIFAENRAGSVVAARSVILALSEIASDKQSDTFEAATSYIAHRAGVTSKTVRRMIKIFKRLRFLRVQPRSENGLKVANEYTLIRGNAAMGPIYPSLGKAPKTDLPRREESSEESRESTARKGKDSLSTHGKGGDKNDEDIVIDVSTGERFNTRKQEYDW
jgi:hypothetical protein